MSVASALANCIAATLDFAVGLWAGQQSVTVTQRDPDNQAVLAAVPSVPAVWRNREAHTVSNESGGEQRIELCHWRFPSELFTTWEPRKHDTITDADGLVWLIDSVRKVGLTGLRFACEAVRILG